MPEAPSQEQLAQHATIAVDLPRHLEARHCKFLIIETAIGAVMSGLVPALLIWWLRPPIPMPLLGTASVATSLIPATLLPGFGMPIIMSLVVRQRVKMGSAPALGWPLGAPGALQFVPRRLLFRGVIAAIIALLILPAAGLLLLKGFGVAAVSGTGFILYNFVHGMALGSLILPAVLILALSDGERLRLA